MKITRKAFDALLEKAIDDLPPQFARWLDEVPIIVEDQPPPEDGDDDAETLGFYHGIPLTQRHVEDSGSPPDQIRIFRRPLIKMCRSLEELDREIRKTLLHELGHYAGLDEDDLEKLGYG